MQKTAHNQQAFTLLELLLTAGITALLMMAVTSLFVTFLMTATKNRLSQNVRETGTSAMQKMTELLRNANSINSTCTTEGAEMEVLELIGHDGLTTTLSQIDDKIASSSAENGVYYLSNNENGEDVDNLGYLQDLTFTCYDTELGPKYIEINFIISTSTTATTNSPTSSSLDFHSGISLRN